MIRPFPSVDGPTFLLFFLILEVLTIIAAEVYVRKTEPKPTREPELFELAWMNGGEAAVLTTSNLLEDRFAYTHEAHNPRPLYRRALNDPLHGLAQLARGNTNCYAARNAPVSPIGPYLEALEQGLIRDGFFRGKTGSAVLTIWLIFTPALVLGVWRSVAGALSGRPVSALVNLIIILLVVAFLYARRVKHRKPMAKRYKKMNKAVRKDKTLRDRPEELPLAYAIGGGALLWAVAPELANFYGVGMSAGNFAGSSVNGSDGGYTSCSSCGSSCGGGGCGGCGGD